jgi:hypothetical protein
MRWPGPAREEAFTLMWRASLPVTTMSWVFFHSISERDGKTLDVVQALAIKVNAKGKIREAWYLADDQRAFDQFWS